MKTILVLSNVLAFIVVLLNFFVDYEWWYVISNPINNNGDVVYGEMYGPLSYFKPIIMYTTLVVVFVNTVVSLFIVRRLRNAT